MTETNKSDRREYMKRYYAENKKELLEKMGQKEECKWCGRSINHQHMFKHNQSKYCQDRYALKLLISKIETDSKNIETI